MTERTTFKPAIWAAVSTRPQAQRDISIPDQVARSRAWLASRGIPEAHPPIIVPGESRQTLVSLSDAETAIPQFKELLDLAGAGTINLVVIVDTDRFRGLLDQVVRALAAYGCQVYSLAQPVELTAPEAYRYFDNDAQLLTFGLAQLMSHADIARFQRKRAVGMAARVDRRGLPPNQIPFGYRRPAGQEHNRAAVPVPVPEERVILQRMRADYMAGHPLQYIADWLNAEGVRGRQGGTFNESSVQLILNNPFYCGIVRRNMTRTRTDPRTRKRVYERLPKESWIMAQGKHEPIWTVEDWQAILDFQKQRGPDHRGAPRRQAFSRLLRCAHCGGPMHAWQPSQGSGYADFRLRYACANEWNPPHAKVYGDDVKTQLRAVLAELAVCHLPDQPVQVSPATEELDAIQRQLDICETKRANYERAQGAGLLTLERLADRLAEVDAEESGLIKRRTQLMDVTARAAAAAAGITRARAFLENYDAWMAGAPPLANAALRQFVDHIVCSREGVVAVQLIG